MTAAVDRRFYWNGSCIDAEVNMHAGDNGPCGIYGITDIDAALDEWHNLIYS